MAYSDFSNLKLIEKKLGLKIVDVSFFSNNIPTKKISQRLVEDINYAKSMPLMSEKAKSELILSPIFKEIRLENPVFSYFSGYTFDVDSNLSLNGVCDFLFTLNNNKNTISSPVFCLVEAKNRTIDESFGQCAAEMYAAKLYNQQEGKEIPIVYGCVTNAYDWCFMKLENDTIYIDLDRYYLNKVDEIVGIMLHILEQFNNLVSS